MPCLDPFPEQTAADDRKRIVKRLHKVTQLLCYLCGELAEDGLLHIYTDACPELKKWQEAHEKSDYARVRGYMEHTIGCIGDPAGLADHFIRKAQKCHPISRFHRKWFQSIAEEVYHAKERRLQEKNEKKTLALAALKKLTPKERKALGL